MVLPIPESARPCLTDPISCQLPCTYSTLATLVLWILLPIDHTKLIRATGPLYVLFPLPGVLLPRPLQA